MSDGGRIDRLQALVAAAPFAVLATRGRAERIDLVPCCFALDRGEPEAVGPAGGPTIVTAVDHKPKRHQRLARLANVERDPRVTVLVDHRDPDDWTALWWVRIRGRAEVVENGPVHERAVGALAAKYPQYREQPPAGPAIRIEPIEWTGWTP